MHSENKTSVWTRNKADGWRKGMQPAVRPEDCETTGSRNARSHKVVCTVHLFYKKKSIIINAFLKKFETMFCGFLIPDKQVWETSPI